MKLSEESMADAPSREAAMGCSQMPSATIFIPVPVRGLRASWRNQVINGLWL